MFLYSLRNRHFYLLDPLLLLVAAYLSFVLRLERLNLETFTPSFLVFTIIALLITPIIFRATGIYKYYWRYASVQELLLLIVATAAATILTYLLSVAVLEHVLGLRWPPRSVPIIFFFLAGNAMALPRLAVRILQQQRRRRERIAQPIVAIMGAGDAGELILREILSSPFVTMRVVGLLDDNPDKYGMSIHGVPVLGTRFDIPRLVQEYGVEQIVIAMPSIPGKVIREITAICKEAGVAAKTIPGLYELLDGRVSVNQLRDVDIDDLLRRDPVQTDIGAVKQLIRGKRVMVTGAGGSIGSELCRQLLSCQPAELHLLGHGENAIFDIYHELLPRAGDTTLIPILADIRLRERLETVFQMHRPQIVFHAAAHKHVPLMEANPSEAVTNNVIGTYNLLHVAQAISVNHFVMLSTDKAVNPTSIMGASKRVAELLVHHAAARSGRHYSVVRFGNVLGSRGSVALTFKQQIAAGGPVTVTDPQMQRFFMTIPEAVQLVMQATILGKGGEVFVLDMGSPVRILDIARDMIELSGLQVGQDIDIEFIGSRPGEKLFEELFIDGEEYKRTAHQKIFVVENAGHFVPPDLEESVWSLHTSARHNDKLAIVRSLCAVVPEYTPITDTEEFSASIPDSPFSFIEPATSSNGL